MVIAIIKAVALVLLQTEMLLMLVRAVLSWFGPGRAYEILVMLTEPIVYPVRIVVERFVKNDALPIDISFFAAYILIYLLEVIVRLL